MPQLSTKTRWWIGGFAFVLPLVAAVVAGVVAGSSASSGASVVALFDLFFASVVVAAGTTAYLALTASGPLMRRLGLGVLVWSMLSVEVWCALLWILRGLQ